MFIWWVMTGWILDFQYCKLVLDFLHYFFNIKYRILFYFIKKHFPDCLTTLNACSKQSTWFSFFKLNTL